MENMGGGFWIGHGLGMVMGWLLLFGLIALVVISFFGQGNQLNNPEESPLEIAKRRYAKGEISKEAFEALKKDLI